MTTWKGDAQCDTSTETRSAAIGGRPFSPDTSFDDSGEKRCPKCDTVKPLARFSKHQNRADGHQSVCKDCELVYRRRTQRASDLTRKYGMTEADWDALLVSQGGGCAICERTDVRLDVDHDHACCPPRDDDKYSLTCGVCRRGIICIRCNTTLGRYREDPRELAARGLHSAVAYLERHARVAS